MDMTKVRDDMEEALLYGPAGKPLRRARKNSLSAASKAYRGNRKERRAKARGGAIGIQG